MLRHALTLPLLLCSFGTAAAAGPENRLDPYVLFVDEMRLSLTIEKPVLDRFGLDQSRLLGALAERTAAIVREKNTRREVTTEEASAFLACDPSDREYRVLHAHFAIGVSPGGDGLLIKGTSRKTCDVRSEGRYAAEVLVPASMGDPAAVQSAIVEGLTDYLTILAVPPEIKPYY